ncbi:HTH domain-containing protein, partial [Lacticaseibacillus rhamnosus]
LQLAPERVEHSFLNGAVGVGGRVGVDTGIAGEGGVVVGASRAGRGRPFCACAELGVSRATVWNAVRALEEAEVSVYKVHGGGEALVLRLNEICVEVAEAVEDGARLIVLSNRGVDADHAPIPSLLLTGAGHHPLVREKTRTQVGLITEAADAREVHHVALLIGYGAAAVNPYLAMATVEGLA